MTTLTCKTRISELSVKFILERALGNYESILLSAGADKTMLQKNRPCPWCGGKDRFSYTDKFGKGDSFCRQCGYHNGIDLLMRLKNFNYGEALRYIASYLNLPLHEEKSVQAKVRRKQSQPVEEIWAASHPILPEDSAYAYLRSRGIKGDLPLSLRASDCLRYAQLSEQEHTWASSFFEGMVAEVVNSDGKRVNLHRTFLQGGRKAPVETVKKVLSQDVSGCVIRLGAIREDGVLGLAEGIETALSASELFNVPVWSVIAAFNFKNFVPPQEVRSVILFADADLNFVGQREAYSAAAELRRRYPELDIEVRLPSAVGCDWNDVLLAQTSNEARDKKAVIRALA